MIGSSVIALNDFKLNPNKGYMTMPFYKKVTPAHQVAAELILRCTDASAIAHYTSVEPSSFTGLCRVILNAALKELPTKQAIPHRHGEKETVNTWLQGLPSLCSVPHSYHDIDQLLATGLIPDEAQKRGADTPSETYFKFLAYVICLYASK